MQNELFSVKIQGKELREFPKDLYIPPDAMLVILEIFEGPLDLLLYLIKKNNLNIIEISMAAITNQYLEYLDKMELANLSLTADYLEMAAILIEIKSRILLPIFSSEQSEEDPRVELIKKLQEYEQIKQAAIQLDQIPRQERDYFIISLSHVTNTTSYLPEVKFTELLLALQQVLVRQNLQVAHTIIKENLSVRDKMTSILTILQSLDLKYCDEESTILNKCLKFSDFLNIKEGRLGVVVTFIAILELVKDDLLEISQIKYSDPIYIRLSNNDQ